MISGSLFSYLPRFPRLLEALFCPGKVSKVSSPRGHGHVCVNSIGQFTLQLFDSFCSWSWTLPWLSYPFSTYRNVTSILKSNTTRAFHLQKAIYFENMFALFFLLLKRRISRYICFKNSNKVFGRKLQIRRKKMTN